MPVLDATNAREFYLFLAYLPISTPVDSYGLNIIFGDSTNIKEIIQHSSRSDYSTFFSVNIWFIEYKNPHQ